MPNVHKNSSNTQNPLRRTSSSLATANARRAAIGVANGSAQRARQGRQVTGGAATICRCSQCPSHGARRTLPGPLHVVVRLRGWEEVRHDADNSEPRRLSESTQLDQPTDRSTPARSEAPTARLSERVPPRGSSLGRWTQRTWVTLTTATSRPCSAPLALNTGEPDRRHRSASRPPRRSRPASTIVSFPARA